MTVYDYDLHDLAQGAFQSIQERALLEQSLRDAPQASTVPPPAMPQGGRDGVVRKIVTGAVVLGAIGGLVYIGNCVLSSGGRA